MPQFTAAVIGLSDIGAAPLCRAAGRALGVEMPYSHVAAYVLSEHAELTAVCDIDVVRVQQFRNDWASTVPDVTTWDQHDRMLGSRQVDLLSVTTPDNLHTRMVLDAAASGTRGILCEKPLATTLEDADAMIEACRSHNVVLLVAYTRRWHPQFVYARALVRQGAIGRLSHIVGTLGGRRAMLFRTGSHLVDAICFFAEAEPVLVAGTLDAGHADYGPRYAGDGGRDPAGDPGAFGHVVFGNGVRALFDISKELMETFDLTLVGDAGRLRVGSHTGEIWRADGRNVGVERLDPPLTTRAGVLAAVEELALSVQQDGRERLSSSGEDGRRTLSILLGILQSSARGGRPMAYPISDE